MHGGLDGGGRLFLCMEGSDSHVCYVFLARVIGIGIFYEVD